MNHNLRYSLLFIFFIFSSSLAAQSDSTKIIHGIVIDDKNEPLIGASIIIKNTVQGTITDIKGKFTLEIPISSNVTLIVSYTGTPYSVITKKQKAFYRINIFKPHPEHLLELGIGMLSNNALWSGHQQRVSYAYRIHFNPRWNCQLALGYNQLNYRAEEPNYGMINSTFQINNSRSALNIGIGSGISYVVTTNSTEPLIDQWIVIGDINIGRNINRFLSVNLKFQILDLTKKNDRISGLASILSIAYSFSN